MKFSKDTILHPGFHMVGAFIFLLLAIFDLMIQGRKYDFDLQSLIYLSILGKIFLIIAAGLLAFSLSGLVVAAYKQIFKK